jgi:predicted MFS family arabinose efflux permease
MTRLLEVIAPARMGPGFRNLLASSWLSNLADGISLAAGPLLVASLTRDPFLVALAPLLQQLPWLLFGLYAGALADRIDRRLLIVTVDLMRAAIIATLALVIATGRANITLVLAAVFLFGLSETFADTATGTLLPMLVKKKDLGVGNARLMTGQVTVNMLLGPPLGAALFASGTAFPFVAQAVCIAAAAVLIGRIRLPTGSTNSANASTSTNDDGSTATVRRDIAVGIKWLVAHPAVRTLALVIFAFNITFGASYSVLVLYSQQQLGMGAIGFGLLTTASALGGLLSTAAYDSLDRRFSPGALMRACLLLEVLVHPAFALANRAWMGLAIMFVFGAYTFVWATVSNTVRQRAVPMEFQGRVSSVYLVGVFGGLVVGSAVGGLLARQWGITAPFWFAFVGTAVTLAMIWRQLPQIAHAE